MNQIKQFFIGLKKGMHDFGQMIALIVNTLLLIFVYAAGFILVSIAAKLARKHFLDTKLDPKAESYWNDLNLKKQDTDTYYRQF